MYVTLLQTKVLLVGTFLLLFSPAGSCLAEEIVAFPPEVRLHGPEASQQVIVHGRHDELPAQPVTENLTWQSRDPSVAKVSTAGVITPVANGETTVTVKSGEASLEIPVTVGAMDEPFAWSFTNHVLPVLSKAGCNMGACHGALAGKGGFRLSLRGYDPPTDHFNIVAQDRGRRVELADPARSLFLAKPSGAIPHKGGLRLETDSRDYRILAEWIAAGAAGPSDADPQLTRLEVFPKRARLSQGDQQQLIVTAHYSDGRAEDVTQWVKWTSSNERVCTVEEDGQVTVVGAGEGAISAWYSSRIAMARVTAPFDNELPEKTFADLPARNFIDEHVNRQLEQLNLPPSPRCDDAAFLRRAYVDTIGLLPTVEETRAFLADSWEDKRDRLIDSLLEREEFIDYWTYKWSDVLMLNGTLLRPMALKAYYEWIRGHVARNTPWDQFVREVLTATGSSYEHGATNFYALHQTPEDMTENACQAFLGLSIGCARCHNHPLEKWTNDQYYGMASLFARVRAKGWGGETRNGDGLRTLYVSTSGELVQPRTGMPQPPTPLDGESIPFDSEADRREHLANWMVSPENPYFAKSITNRVWANFFGVGLVEAVDDMRVSNPASNPELLEAAADHLVDNKFDLRTLMKVILQSEAYQRSSIALDGNASEQRFYSRYYPRRMMAEVLHDAIVQVTEVPTKFEFVAFPGADRQKTDFYPLGTRATELYDSAVESYFLETFGRNERNITCECERSDEPSMVQVLHLSNGVTLNEKLKSNEGRVERLAALTAAGLSDAALIDEAYLACLSRFPTHSEREQFQRILSETPANERRIVVEDLFWAIMSSREFVFNH